jgi:hypothetical protein
MSAVNYEPQFNYDVADSVENNFSRWFDMTNYEHYRYGEKELSIREGKKIFNSLFAVNLI